MKYQPIDRNLFIENRKRLSKRLKPRSIAVFNSNDIMPTSADGVHPFIQQTDLFYLCGIDQEETILILCPDAHDKKLREILFIKKTSPETLIWEGHKYTPEQATDISGVATVRNLDAFETIFQQLVFESENIYLNINEHLRADMTVASRDMRFLRHCQTYHPLHKYERLAPLMHELRVVKSEVEVALIKHAAEITKGAFFNALKCIAPDVWEFEIEAEIHYEFLKKRSNGPAYATIVASGGNACVLHYIKNDQQLKDGDLLLMDFGAEYAHYAADVTRTIPINGRFSKRQKAVYDAVLRVQRDAIQLLKPGMLMEDYNHAVGKIMQEELRRLGLLSREEINAQTKDKPAYRKYFMHGASHHLGLDVHDYGSKYRAFEVGMVMTCEPGIYIADESIGIRLEDDILITADGPVNLTADIPIDADEIEALMRSGV